MKSIDEPGQSSIMKEDKELKPASLRVRDAAEKLLACILQQVSCSKRQNTKFKYLLCIGGMFSK